ncbi:GNAT family protein [Sporosarcina sp. FSL K6-3508]|uniref:GNAT family N-acetyltransferase n=1 Tax=Sporosarcina sp. FSL K6-3508 TaxID=2921557 RepID=UPI003159CCBE
MQNDNKFPILETDRLILRQVTEEDAGSLLAYLSDPTVVKHMGFEPFLSIDDAINEISWYRSIFDEGSGIRWGIALKEDDVIIGSCGFLNWIPKHYRSEIGFELSRSFWGKGIANEALEIVLAYGFKQMNLQRIEALIEPPNESSKRLVENHSFVREGLLRSYECTLGKFVDLYMYSLLKEEFLNA